jgi:hypothetical protein
MARLASCSMFAPPGRPSNLMHSTATRFNIPNTRPSALSVERSR